MNKIACLTLDIEWDYHREHVKGHHLIKEWLFRDDERLKNLFHPLDIKVTAFIVGEILQRMPLVIDSLKNANIEVELHSYSHSLKRDPSIDIPHGINVYFDVTGEMPLGYRAPEGVLIPKELKYLEEYGFKFDSSIFPFFRFGKFCNFRLPQKPYFIKNSTLIEFPIGSIPIVRLPIALSYIMFLGWDTYESMFRVFGLPNIIVFDFHLHDLFPSKSFKNLPDIWKFFYSTIYKRNPWKYFKKIINFLKNNGYSFLFMKELYDKIITNEFYLDTLI